MVNLFNKFFFACLIKQFFYFYYQVNLTLGSDSAEDEEELPSLVSKIVLHVTSSIT